ncbi:hypothetical protein QTP86_026370, partial [Hemibagrus guttatus]
MLRVAGLRKRVCRITLALNPDSDNGVKAVYWGSLRPYGHFNQTRNVAFIAASKDDKKKVSEVQETDRFPHESKL